MNETILREQTLAAPLPGAALRRLGEALGLQPHYEALDRLLAEQFGVARWINCLVGDDGAPLPVAAGAPGATPTAREVELLDPSAVQGRSLLPGVALDALPGGPFTLPPAARPYQAGLAYRFRHRTLGVLLVEMTAGSTPTPELAHRAGHAGGGGVRTALLPRAHDRAGIPGEGSLQREAGVSRRDGTPGGRSSI